MPYIINNTDSSLTVTVADGVVDTTSYSLALVGRNVSNYGQYFAQNTIRQMENFASTTPPSATAPLVGQLWYDKSEELFRVYDGSIWKRATNISVGTDANKPVANFGDGGAAFYNTTIDKLQIHDGTAWKNAGYAGEVTSAYSTASLDGNPSAFGSRIRNIFLTDTTGRKHSVLAVSYVKTTSQSGQNAGSTSIDGQSETIMMLFSDSEFTISPSIAPIVDGQPVPALYTELTSSEGIAAVRSGRPAGLIQKGANTRYEYEQDATVFADSVYVKTNLGSLSQRVLDIYTGNIDSLGSITSSSSESDVLTANTVNVIAMLDVSGDADIDGTVTIGGDLTATTGAVTFSDLTVSSDTRLNGNTAINGNLTVNGVFTQSLGAPSSRIEDFFGDDATITTIVSETATIQTVSANDATIQTVSANDATITNGTFTNLEVTSNVDVTGAVNATGDVISQSSIIGSALTDGTASLNGGSLSGAVNGTFSGTVTATTFDGVATSARYADLAEIYKADSEYAPGTVVKLGGSEEITQTVDEGDTEVFGVISTDPAYLMNSDAQGLAVAMTGRVPVSVSGTVKKGERLISSSVPGVAIGLGDTAYDPRKIIGRALQDKTTDDINLIEAVIGVK